MNEFENNLVQSVMQGLHDFEIKMAETIGEIRGDLKSLTKAVNNSVAVDTKRLDAHAAELDEHRDRIIKLEDWKEQRVKEEERSDKKVGHRIAISGTIAVIVAVILAYLLTKL